MKPYIKKCLLRMTIPLIGYALGIWTFLHFYIEQPHKSQHRNWLIFLPLLSIIYMTFCLIRVVSDLDEMKRKIITEAMAFSGIATGFTCFSYMFLRDMGAPEFHGEWAIYIMWIYYFIGLFFSWRRYR